MSRWAKPNDWIEDAVDLDVIEESALAMAQSTIQKAINKSGMSRAEMARRMKCHRSFVSRMMTGSHNLTVKTMAKSLAVCGFEVRFKSVPLECNWAPTVSAHEEVEPANAGPCMLTPPLNMQVPAFAISGE